MLTLIDFLHKIIPPYIHILIRLPCLLSMHLSLELLFWYRFPTCNNEQNFIYIKILWMNFIYIKGCVLVVFKFIFFIKIIIKVGHDKVTHLFHAFLCVSTWTKDETDEVISGVCIHLQIHTWYEVHYVSIFYIIFINYKFDNT